MKQKLTSSFFKTLLGVARRKPAPVRRVLPLSPDQLRQVAGGDGGSDQSPKGGW